MPDKAGKLPKYVQSYYDSILADFEATPPPDPGDKVATKALEDAQKIIARYPDITWKDIYVLELAVVRLQPHDKLKRRAWVLRAKFKQTVTPEVYDAYLKSNPPDPDKASVAELRADLEKLLEEFHWLYTASRAREQRLQAIKKMLVLGTLLLVLVIAGVNWFYRDVTTLGVIAIAGMLGALMSIVRRLQDVGARPLSASDPIMELAGLDAGMVGICIALVSGAVFAVLLYLLFVAGMSELAGNLVPTIVSDANKPECGLTFSGFLVCTGPATGVDFAKLVVWSFIAGFAERLVPDVLDRIAKTAQKAS